MPIIPETLAQTESFLENHPSFANFLSTYTYDRLLSRDPNHPLIQLNTLLDLSPMEMACANYHKQEGPGCTPTHTMPKLLRALLVKYFYNYSLRELEYHIRYNLLLKWFIGYAIFEEGPDHTTLWRFEMFLVLHHSRRFFDTVLNQIDRAFPHDRTRPQIGDTFAVHADAALESLIKRLRHSCQNLLVAYRTAYPVAYDVLWEKLDRDALFGPTDEQIEYYLSTEQRQQRLLCTLNATCDCLSLVQAHPLAPAVQKWVACLDKIMRDELRLERDKAGLIIQAAFLAKNKRGTYPIFSATDPDATIRNHGPGKKDPGYNASVAATVDFIREIRADTGSQPDPVAIPDLLLSQMAQHDVCPEKFIYDQAAGLGKYAADVDQATHGQTQLVAKPMPTTNDATKFGPQDFTLSADELSLTCPHGRRSVRKYRAGAGTGFIFRFMKSQCVGCPFLQQCRPQKDGQSVVDPPTTKRDVFISDYYLFYARLLAYSQTKEFKQDMLLRPHIERIIAALALHNGARRARFRGLEKVDYQLKMCAMAYNLKRWLSLLSGKRYKKRRRFGAPTPSRGEVGLCAA